MGHVHRDGLKPANPDPHSIPSARGALAGLALAMLLSSLGTSIANVALPTLAAAFDTSFQAVQWVVLAYLLAITSTIVSVGALGDRVGRRRLLRAGLVLFVGASLVCGLAPTLWLLILARALQGLGAALMMALTIAFVSEIVPKAKTGSAMGLLGTTSAIGTSLGPSLGGVLIDQLGWPAIFLVNVPIGLVAILLVHRYLPLDRPTPEASRGAFDKLGTLVLALTLVAYALAMTLGHGPRNAALLVAALIGVVGFLLVERRAATPLVRLSMFRDPATSASLAATSLVSTVLMATLVVGPFYLSLALGLDVGVVGTLMSIGPIVAALTGLPAGRVVDRFGTHAMTLVGLVGIAAGCVALWVLPESLGIPGYVAPIVVVTASYALFQTANNTAIMRDVDPSSRGVMSGTLNLARNLGLVTGASLMGVVFAFGSGSAELGSAPPEAIAAGMRFTFAVAAGLILVAIAAIVGAARRVRRSGSTRLLAATLALLLIPSVAAAEEPASPALTKAGPTLDRGFVLRSPDRASSVRIVGLLQPQLTHSRVDGSDHDALFINRARVGLLGSLFSRDLQYMFVAEFAGEAPKLLFLQLDYALVPDWLTLRVGQFKRPFSRPFMTLASQLSMIDRPSTVGAKVFGDNADLGVMLHSGSAHGSGTPGRFEYALGVFAGTGPGTTTDPIHPLVATRVGYSSQGMDPYSESDLEGGGPRIGVGVAAMVDLDLDADHESFASGLVDVKFEAQGFSLSSALYLGSRQAGPRWADQRLRTLGHYTQVGYVIAKRVEPVLRYSLLSATNGRDDQHDIAGGLNVFVHGHAFKWQNFVSARVHVIDSIHGAPTRSLVFQSQLSLAF